MSGFFYEVKISIENIFYILFSEKLSKFYISFTENLNESLLFHQNAESRKFTYNEDDWSVFLTIECISKVQGLNIEKHIKSMKSKIYLRNLKKHIEISKKLLDRYT